MNNQIFQKLNENLENKVQQNILLNDYTTYHVGGPAEYLIEADNMDLLVKSFKMAQELNINCLFLGGGSNVIIADQGIRGLVIINRVKDVKIIGEIIEVTSGYNLSKLVKETALAGLSGLDFAAGIYGTVGGAVSGNAGAYGSDMSRVVTEIEVIESNGKIKRLKNDDLKFKYRSSIFKDEGYPGMILRTWLKLSKDDPEKIMGLIQQHLEERLMNGQEDYPSAGCVFRNIPFNEINLDELKNKGVAIDKFKEIKKIPAGYLIECLDLKGKKIGGAMVSKEHGNFIYNISNATADDIVTLISYIKQQVRDNYGIQLKEEIKYLGFG